MCTHVWTGVFEWGIPQCWAMFWERSTLSTCEEVHMFADATVSHQNVDPVFVPPPNDFPYKKRPAGAFESCSICICFKAFWHTFPVLRPKGNGVFLLLHFRLETRGRRLLILYNVPTRKRIHFSKVELHTLICPLDLKEIDLQRWVAIKSTILINNLFSLRECRNLFWVMWSEEASAWAQRPCNHRSKSRGRFTILLFFLRRCPFTNGRGREERGRRRGRRAFYYFSGKEWPLANFW